MDELKKELVLFAAFFIFFAIAATPFLNGGDALIYLSGAKGIFEGKGYVEFKNNLAEVTVEFLKPFQARRAEFANDMPGVIKILDSSEEKCRILAQQTLDEVKSKMGLS